MCLKINAYRSPVVLLCNLAVSSLPLPHIDEGYIWPALPSVHLARVYHSLFNDLRVKPWLIWSVFASVARLFLILPHHHTFYFCFVSTSVSAGGLFPHATQQYQFVKVDQRPATMRNYSRSRTPLPPLLLSFGCFCTPVRFSHSLAGFLRAAHSV